MCNQVAMLYTRKKYINKWLKKKKKKKIWCCCGCGVRLAAIAPIRPLAWKPPYATSAALKSKKKKKKKKKQRKKENYFGDDKIHLLVISLICVLPGKKTCFFLSHISVLSHSSRTQMQWSSLAAQQVKDQALLLLWLWLLLQLGFDLWPGNFYMLRAHTHTHRQKDNNNK